MPFAADHALPRSGAVPTPARRLDPDHLGDHLDRLYRAAWALCGSREDAEDLVQETYARVLQKPRLLRSDDDLGYLLRVLRNTYFSRLRAAARRPRADPLPDELDRIVDPVRQRARSGARRLRALSDDRRAPGSVSRGAGRDRRRRAVLPRGGAARCAFARRRSRPACTEPGSGSRSRLATSEPRQTARPDRCRCGAPATAADAPACSSVISRASPTARSSPPASTTWSAPSPPRPSFRPGWTSSARRWRRCARSRTSGPRRRCGCAGACSPAQRAPAVRGSRSRAGRRSGSG